MDRRLSRAHTQRIDSSFERGDATLQYFGCRVGDSRIAVALDLEIEQRRPVVGAVEGIGDRLVDRHRDGLRRRIALVAAMNGDRLAFHVVTSQSCPTSELISRTTHSMSDSVVRKLVTHARTTGAPPPSRTSDIQAIWRS